MSDIAAVALGVAAVAACLFLGRPPLVAPRHDNHARGHDRARVAAAAAASGPHVAPRLGPRLPYGSIVDWRLGGVFRARPGRAK
jgi:hypothetical protein